MRFATCGSSRLIPCSSIFLQLSTQLSRIELLMPRGFYEAWQSESAQVSNIAENLRSASRSWIAGSLDKF